MLGELKQNISGQRSKELATELDAVKDKTTDNAASIESVKKDMALLTNSITELSKQQEQLLMQSKETIAVTEKLKENVEESISSLKLISSTIQNNLVNKISDDLGKISDEVSEKLGGSEKVKNEVELTATKVKEELDSLREEIQKLTTVSSKINAKDFEMTKVAQHLIKEDNEKLRLQREIDSLQRLASGMRRRQR